MNDIKPLSEEDIATKLEKLPGWIYADNKIGKQFEFKDFKAALVFVNELGAFSEKVDHHPDIHIYYNKVCFELQRFDIGGKVTDRDFTVAHEIERMYGVRPEK